MRKNPFIVKSLGIILGPLLYLVIKYTFEFDGLSEAGIGVLAGTAWIALWWITEVVEIEVTALLPIILFPLNGGLDLAATCACYGHKYIFLFLGGFILALTIQKWDLHKRIAFNIILKIGTQPERIILGFMISTAIMSMWISNTATTVMMLPIALAVTAQFNKDENSTTFSTALLLSIAYAASIGGISTLIGTPPNLILAGVVQEIYNIEISFTMWMAVGLPISVVMLTLCWLYLTSFINRSKGDRPNLAVEPVRQQLKDMGPISYEEKVVLAVFLTTALAWICRSFLLQKIVPGIDDTVIAVTAALILFILPSSKGKGSGKLLTWQDTVKLPWGVLILFGGGIAISEGFQESGLASWIADNMTMFHGMALVLIVLILVLLVNFLTEITSNLATTSVLLPVLAPMALAIDINPFYLMVGATLAASCAFMLPVATPPNAIVFGSKQLTLRQMMKAGLWMNMISIVVITLFVYFILPLIWGNQF